MASKNDIPRRIAEQAPATLVYLDNDLRVRFANRHCHGLLGHGPDELHGRPLQELVDTGTFKSARAHVAELEQGGGAPREYALRHKNGTKRFLQVSAAADRDAGGRNVGYVLSGFDNSGERAARADLSAAQQRLNLALDVSEAGLWSWDLADFPAHFPLLGSLHPDERDAMLDALSASIRNGARFDREFRVRRGDGDWRWLRAVGHAVPDAAAPGGGRFEGVGLDITRRKAVEHELRDAQAVVLAVLDRCAGRAKDQAHRQTLDRMRSRLLEAANHALRPPLASIIGALELLQDESLQPSIEAPESLLALALENAGRLAGVIEQWLEMERIDIGPMLLRCKPLDLSAMVARLVEELARPGRPRLRFERMPGAELARVNADALKLRQALSHLIAGAIDRSPKGGTVEVRLAVRGQQALLTIEDQAAHANLSADLSVFIAKTLVERLEGALHFENRAGRGALVTLTLPTLAELTRA